MKKYEVILLKMIETINKTIKKPVIAASMIGRMFITAILFPLRRLIYKKIGFFTYISLNSSVRNHHVISLENRVKINAFVTLWPIALEIGYNTEINPGTAIYGKVKIGNYVMIAPNCMIAGGNHNFKDTKCFIMFQGSTEKGIIIGDDVWIGANSTILDGVIVGNGAIVGANSVVTKSVPPYAIVYGNPAEVVNWRKNLNSVE